MTTPPKIQFLSKTNGAITNLNYKNFQNVIKTKMVVFFIKRCANFSKTFFPTNYCIKRLPHSYFAYFKGNLIRNV